MKRLIFLLALISIGTAHAQKKVVFGAKAGANFTGFHTENGTNSDQLGINIGCVAKLELNKAFGVQTELNFNQKGGNYRIPLVLQTPRIKLSYLNIPVLAKVHITRKFSFETGPEFGFLVGKKGTANGETLELEGMKTFDVNANIGLSYEFEKSIFIQTRYGYGFTKLFEGSDYKNSCISLSLGYFFK